jgi:hypothetical protein
MVVRIRGGMNCLRIVSNQARSQTTSTVFAQASSAEQIYLHTFINVHNTLLFMYCIYINYACIKVKSAFVKITK